MHTIIKQIVERFDERVEDRRGAGSDAECWRTAIAIVKEIGAQPVPPESEQTFEPVDLTEVECVCDNDEVGRPYNLLRACVAEIEALRFEVSAWRTQAAYDKDEAAEWATPPRGLLDAVDTFLTRFGVPPAEAHSSRVAYHAGRAFSAVFRSPLSKEAEVALDSLRDAVEWHQSQAIEGMLSAAKGRLWSAYPLAGAARGELLLLFEILGDTPPEPDATLDPDVRAKMVAMLPKGQEAERIAALERENATLRSIVEDKSLSTAAALVTVALDDRREQHVKRNPFNNLAESAGRFFAWAFTEHDGGTNTLHERAIVESLRMAFQAFDKDAQPSVDIYRTYLLARGGASALVIDDGGQPPREVTDVREIAAWLLGKEAPNGSDMPTRGGLEATINTLNGTSERALIEAGVWATVSQRFWHAVPMSCVRGGEPTARVLQGVAEAVFAGTPHAPQSKEPASG
jgi:hypothetical protein